MDEKSVKKFILFSCIVLFAAIFYELKYITELSLFKRNNFLIVGVLSSPENYQRRLSLRETWLKLLSEISASAYFIIGNNMCQVPPYDRADPYSCIEKPFVLPKNASNLTEFTTSKIQNTNSKLPTSVFGFVGFGFSIRSSIKVHKLGILKELLEVFDKDIQVKLISAVDNKVLASVTFNTELLSDCDSLVLSKAIRPVELNADFEGFLKLEMKDVPDILFPDCNYFLWEKEPYVINFIQLWQGGSVMPQPFREDSCSFVFMNYTIIDTESIKQQIHNRTLRLKEWHESTKKLYQSIKNESDIYKDIILVDVTDVYRNLSLKLTHFYKQIISTENFRYVLKTDDDSFIDVLRVYEQLKLNDMETSKFWWWSYFKEFWVVQHSGKWRENQYQSASYPTFPCGGGYVLNKGIVDYIVGNNHLHHFQGEDVSLGIWLSPLSVTRFQTPKVVKDTLNDLQQKIITQFKSKQSWEYINIKNSTLVSNLCEWTCNNIKHFSIPLCNKVQLSVENMYSVWEDYIEKGFL